MAQVYAIWSQKEHKIVPAEDATYPSSQAASDAIRRLVKNAGNAKDVQSRVYDVLGPLTIS